PSVTGVFDPGGASGPTQSWLVPSEIPFGWTSSTTPGVGVVNQFNHKDIFARRPFGMATRDEGRRAIVPFFQTGNFGILDLDAQTNFTKEGLSSLPTDLFQGFVAVTPALRLDNHLWPRRGAFGENPFMPSPDENLLFPW